MKGTLPVSTSATSRQPRVGLVRAKAPLRISFAGGGTDVPPFPAQEGGCVISATINRYAWGTLRPRTDGQFRIRSLDLGQSLTYASRATFASDGELALPKAAITRLAGDHSGGYDLFLHTDAPPGSGLGSSSAMLVVLVGLLKEFHGLPLTEYEVADTAYQIERVDLAIRGGMQDQYAAAFGGFNFIEFDAERVVVSSLRLGREIINELEYHLLLCHTGRLRLSSNVIDDQVARYEQGDAETTAALRAIKALAHEMRSALLARRLDDFGRLLDEEWQHKRRMSTRISSPQLDELYAVARANGALGGKVTGAGGGGYMLLYCRFDQKHDLAERMRGLGCEIHDFAFERYGLQSWWAPAGGGAA